MSPLQGGCVFCWFDPSESTGEGEALLLDNLDDVLVLHGVCQAHPLRAVLGAGALGVGRASSASERSPG